MVIDHFLAGVLVVVVVQLDDGQGSDGVLPDVVVFVLEVILLRHLFLGHLEHHHRRYFLPLVFQVLPVLPGDLFVTEHVGVVDVEGGLYDRVSAESVAVVVLDESDLLPVLLLVA